VKLKNISGVFGKCIQKLSSGIISFLRMAKDAEGVKLRHGNLVRLCRETDEGRGYTYKGWEVTWGLKPHQAKALYIIASFGGLCSEGCMTARLQSNVSGQADLPNIRLPVNLLIKVHSGFNLPIMK